MKLVLVTVAVCALAFAASASGAGRVADDRYSDCLKKAQTTVAMINCNGAEYRRVEAELNRVYRQLAARLASARRALLARSQQRWIAYREAECMFAGSVATGGTLEPVLRGGCLIDLTKKRTRDLRAYLKQPA